MQTLTKIILIIVLLLAPMLLHADCVVVVGQPAAAPASCCDLLDEEFESSDGTNMHGYNSWAGDDVDALEIDTAQYNAGSSSCLVAGANTTALYEVVRSITSQSTGKFTVSVYFRIDANDNTNYQSIIALRNSSSGNATVNVMVRNNDVFNWTGSATQIAENVVSADTWHHVEIEVDQDNYVFDLYFDGTEYDNSGSHWAFYNNEATDRIWIYDSTTAGCDNWKDQLCVYAGARDSGCE